MDNRQFGKESLASYPDSPEKDMIHALWVELDIIAAYASKERDRIPFCLAGDLSVEDVRRQVSAARRVTSWACRVTDRVRAKVRKRSNR